MNFQLLSECHNWKVLNFNNINKLQTCEENWEIYDVEWNIQFSFTNIKKKDLIDLLCVHESSQNVSVDHGFLKGINECKKDASILYLWYIIFTQINYSLNQGFCPKTNLKFKVVCSYTFIFVSSSELKV